MSKRITLRDVAERAGVSAAAASMALRDHPNIPAHTADRVRAAASALGYVPDAMARSLRTHTTQSVGFVSDEVTVTRFASAMVRGILDVGQQRDRAVLMMETGRQPSALARGFAALEARRVDAIIVGLMDSAAIDLPPVDAGLPVVMVNATAADRPAILPDEFDAGRRAVRLLLDHGHRRIAAVGLHPQRPGPRVSVNIGVRMDGIAAELDAAGLTFCDVHHGTVWEPDLGWEGANAILDRTPDVTAFLALNDRIAFGIHQAVHARGLRIPDDISLMSFDDEQLASILRPQLTTLHLPYRAMGEEAMRMAVTSQADCPPVTLIPLPLVTRDSVRSI